MEENRRLNTTLVQPLPVGEVPGIAAPAPARLPRPGCIYCSLPGRGAAGAGRRSPPQKCPRPSVCRPTCSPTSRPPGAAGRRGSTRRCASGSGTRTPRDRPARGREGGWLPCSDVGQASAALTRPVLIGRSGSPRSQLLKGFVTRSDGVRIGRDQISPLAGLEPILATLFEPAVSLVGRDPAIEEI